MSLAQQHITELYELADAQCAGLLTAEQTARLEKLVIGSPELRRLYIWYMHVHASAEMNYHGESLGTISSAPPVVIQPCFSVPLASPSSFVGGVLFSYLMATLVLGAAITIAWAWKLPNHPQVAWQPSSSAEGRHSASKLKPTFVGRITGMVDCRWEEGAGVRDQGSGAENPTCDIRHPTSLVALGDRLALASGLVEIAYNTGAKVILQGPVRYEVESVAGGFLSFGKLTARLEKGEGRRGKAEGVASGQWPVASGNQQSTIINQQSSSPQSPIPNPSSAFRLPPSPFVVRTPTATVTDLGTEFGVEVDKQGGTTSHVFRGSVRVQVVGGGKSEGSGQVLFENASARVAGGNERTIVVVSAAQPAEFIRRIPARKIKVLDLVDVVAGGDGYSGKRNCGIDPHNGRFITNPYNPEFAWMMGDYRYHRTQGLPFVDGAFIPDGSRGPVQTDSAGHTCDCFLQTVNGTAGPVWAGGLIPTANPDPVRTDLDGVDYSKPGHGLLSMISNKGLTFDLDAIRRANPGYTVLRFRGVVGNPEGTRGLADLWVIVDGRPRFRRRQINLTGGGFAISEPIAPKDRFLTLAATDGGDGISWDCILFGDPRLELVESAVSKPATEGKAKR
jgi:hypothetical protein